MNEGIPSWIAALFTKHGERLNAIEESLRTIQREVEDICEGLRRERIPHTRAGLDAIDKLTARANIFRPLLKGTDADHSSPQYQGEIHAEFPLIVTPGGPA